MLLETALELSDSYLDSGEFTAELARRVAIRTESPDPESHPELSRYLVDELSPTFATMGFVCEVFENPIPGAVPSSLLAALRARTFQLSCHMDTPTLCEVTTTNGQTA